MHYKVKKEHKGVFQCIMKTLIWFTLRYCAICLQVQVLSIKIQNTQSYLINWKYTVKSHLRGWHSTYLLPEEVYSQQFPWLRVILGHCFSLLPAVKVKTPISYIVGTPHLHPPQQMQSLTEEDMTSCRDSDAPEAGGAAELVQMRLNTTAVLQMPDLGLGF